jgi:hypothetical protein
MIGREAHLHGVEVDASLGKGLWTIQPGKATARICWRMALKLHHAIQFGRREAQHG